MKRELVERPNQLFHTSTPRGPIGSRKWSRPLAGNQFPKIGETTKGIAVKESTKPALKIESRTLPACNTRGNQKIIPTKGKTPHIAQGRLLRNSFTTRRSLATSECRQAYPQRNTSREKDQETAENQKMTTNAQLITERRKTIRRCVRKSNIVNKTGGTFSGSSQNNGVENGEVSSIVLNLPEQRDSGNHQLPPLNISRVDTHNGSTYSRLLALVERRQFNFNPRMRLDWKRLLTREGFHPNEAREMPTVGEMALLRSRTWEKDAEPVGCIRKYAGLDSRRRATTGNTRNQFHVRNTPRGLITVASQSPLTSTHHFYSISSRLTDSRTQTYYLKSSPTPPPMRWSYATCPCFAPPATPSSPVFRSSPTRQLRSQSMIGRQSGLEDIEETETCSLGELDKDEGIGTPSTEDSIDDLNYFL